MIAILEEQLRKLLTVKLSYNSLVDLQSASVLEIRIALNDVIKDIISENYNDIYRDKTQRFYIVSFELMLENLFQHYIEKLNLKKSIQHILGEKYEDVVNFENDLHLGQSYIGRFSVDLFERISNQGKFCKAYSIFYKNSQFKQKIVEDNQIETTFHGPKTSVVFKRLNEYDLEIENNRVKSQIHDIPYLGNNVSFVRLFVPKANPNLNYENFICGKLEDIYSQENKLNSIRQFVYTPEINEFGKYVKFLQQKFLSESIIEDIFNDELKIFNKTNEIEEHIQINIIETNMALVIIQFMQKFMDLGFDFEQSFKKCTKIFRYYNINLHRESFEKMDLNYLYQNESMKNIIQQLNEKALMNGFPEIIQGNYLDCFNILAFMSKKISVGSEYQKRFLSKSEFVNINENIARKISVETYGFNENLFGNDIQKENLFEEKLIYKKNLITKYNLKNVNAKSIFNMQLTDFHEGKRQVMNVLYILYLYLKLKDNVNVTITSTTFFIGGMSSFDYLFCKKTISLCAGLSKIINSDKYIQEKIKLVFVENIMLDQVPDFAKACDVFNYIPYKNFDVSNTYPYAFMNNAAIIVASDNSVYQNVYQIDNNSGVFKFDEGRLEVNESTAMNFILQNIDKLKNQKVIDEFFVILNLIKKYDDSFNVIKSLDNFVELNDTIQKMYLDEYKWNEKVIRNIKISKKFGIDYINSLGVMNV